MSKRTIGGGRVLGSGRSLVPNAPASTSSPRPSRVFSSPTPSNLTLGSPRSSSATPVDIEDLQSRISRSNGASSSSVPRLAETASSRLACPICDEEMVTLLQLNRHIDDAHQYLEEERQVEVKDWFQIQVEKAKRFQPLAVLNQKLKGKQVFESNNGSLSPAVSHTRSTSGDSHKYIEPDEAVTRDHWQARTFQDRCFDPTCDKRLTATTGAVKCRKCGKLFCEEHTMYQMKLSRSAQHEPVRGIWCRCPGTQRDLLSSFSAIRKPNVDKAFLEVSRLEKRLSRLTNLLAKLPPDQIQSGAIKRWPLWRDDERKKIEQMTLFERRDFEEDTAKETPDLRAYRNLRQFESGIRALLPRFQKLLHILQDPDNPPTPEQLAEASKVRKRLIDAFAKYDIAARRIRDLPTQSPTQAKLQKAIHLQATNFLHLHMLPLKSLPKLLKHATPYGEASTPTSQPRALAAIKYGNYDAGLSPSSVASGNSSAISALETEEKQLKEQLAVLEEQRFFVSEMAADANRRRKFDEAKSLQSNAEDLGREIESISQRIEKLDFRSLYTSPQVPPEGGG
ncbi:hypothetical protein KEM56_005212 [Ascosphaera pollenicola]|nr:hypothetical protein KEM56_005212 [Ascosphaera pollenicola]